MRVPTKTAVILLTTLILLAISCREGNIVTPTPPKPPGYQEDIPWPSLADSPWPMHHHDPQSTGRSPFIGPKAGIITNEYTPEFGNIRSGITFGLDSNIYFVTGEEHTTGLYSINNVWEVQWFIEFEHATRFTTPLITSSGDIICFDGNFKLLSLSPSGIINWQFDLESEVTDDSPNIDKDGNLYFLDYKKVLHAVSPTGELLWNLYDERFNGNASNQPTFSPDGNTIYIPGKSTTVLAIDIRNQVIKWVYGNDILRNAAVVDSDGNLYCAVTRGMISLHSNGELRWFYPLKNVSMRDNIPAIDRYGNIYYATDTLYSFNYKGYINWKVYLGGISDAPIICDRSGMVYVGIGLPVVKIVAVDNEGKIAWEIEDNTQVAVGFSPAISNEGFMYYPLVYDKLLTIK